jgi:hypothetical protein
MAVGVSAKGSNLDKSGVRGMQRACSFGVGRAWQGKFHENGGLGQRLPALLQPAGLNE